MRRILDRSMAESSRTSNQEIAEQVKEIYKCITKSSTRDTEYLAKACKKLRSKSEAGYGALVRLLHKEGLLNILVDINNYNDLQRLCNGGNPSSVQDESELSSQPTSSFERSTSSCQLQLSKNAPSSMHHVNNAPTSKSDKGQSKSEKYERTKDFLSKSGLLGITNKTAELLKLNKELQKEIDGLKQQTESFVQSVLANPENQGLLRKPNVTYAGSQAIFESPQIVMAPADSSDFASFMSSGFYDLELPSVILAPMMDSNEQTVSLEESSPPRKRPKIC